MNNYAFSRMDLKEDEKIAVEEKKAQRSKINNSDQKLIYFRVFLRLFLKLI